ncbi:hypothetical protein SAMN05660909_04687 [Chitinophaga terrae (ex Kim and Jung 2007)]|jgi:hypothetical protein|uniref:DUF4834 family protein n=1 Tax=Chitinophaga terrae (ex Kim and Jung 2007) TaxID=408074 RepID=A0A1H4FTT2_9BACT|nr:hypothetical protein SAMN05660909_04687 [Chitinophaga terrae (ex Kim and Jung 2007)]
MFKFLFSIFLAWLLYKLIFNLIIPGYRVTKEVRRQMHNMQDHMRQQYEQQQAAYGQVPKDPPKQQKPTDRGEYIDFEEIK